MHGYDGLDAATGRGSGYLELSLEYAAAASLLAASPEPGTIDRAFWAIASHALELSLKAFLRARGSSEERLIMIGHSLQHGLSSCLAQGMLPGDGELVGLVDALGSHHEAQTFRYPGWDVDPNTLPSPAQVVRVLSGHVERIGAMLGQCSCALPPSLRPTVRLLLTHAPQEGPLSR